MTLWEVVTGNSSLPVQAGNTFWDHLQSTASSVVSKSVPPPIIYGETLVFVEEHVRVVYDDENINVLVLEDHAVLDSETSVDLTNEL